jgi:lipid-binding SYLF domain-containing protein
MPFRKASYWDWFGDFRRFSHLPYRRKIKNEKLCILLSGGHAMNNRHRVISAIFGFMVLFVLSAAHADPFENTIAIFKKSDAVLPFFENSYGYAVFPTIGKAGIGIGGAYGKGKVYQGGKITGETKMVKATIGFQLGGQVFSEIIFFEDKRAYDEFTTGEFEFDASASAVAITTGAQISAGSKGATAGASAGPATGVQAETRYRKGMAVFVHAKGGLMYEAAIGGQKFTFKPSSGK